MNEINLEYEQEIREDVANGRYVPWFSMLWRNHLSEEFLLEFVENFGIAQIFCYQKLSIETIEKIIDNYDLDLNDWENLSYYQKLSESFVDKYSSKLNWNLISANKNLSLNLFRKFSYKLNWHDFFTTKNHLKDLQKNFLIKFTTNIFLGAF